jgi:UDP-glucuronate 4-epimerase
MENLLITGGAGFIGSNLIEELLGSGRFFKNIICIDDFNDYYDPKIKYGNISGFRDDPGFILYEADITDLPAINDIFKKHSIDMVIHLAARAGVRPSIKNPGLYWEVNIGGTLNLLELCREYGVKKFIFASSSSVYGNNKKTPFSEEDCVDFPISPYAATKKSGELLCYNYHHLYNISVFCLRFFTVYGPRQRPEMAIHKFTRLIDSGTEVPVYGRGDSSRDYTYIDDIVSGLEESIKIVKGYEIINLGNSKPVKLLDLIRIIEENIGKKAIIREINSQPGDVDTTFADITRAKKLLKYSPETALESGIRKFVKWFREQEKKIGG